MVSLSECAERLFAAQLLTDKEFDRIKSDLDKRRSQKSNDRPPRTRNILRFLTAISPIHVIGFAVLAAMTMLAREEFDMRTDTARLTTLLLSPSNIIALLPHLAAIVTIAQCPGAMAQEQYSAWAAVGLLWGLCAQVLSMLASNSDVDGNGGCSYIVVLLVQSLCLSIAFSAPIIARSTGVVIALPPFKLAAFGVPIYFACSLLFGAVLSCEDESLIKADICGNATLHTATTRPPATALLLLLAVGTMVWRSFTRIRFSVENITVRRYVCQCLGFMSSIFLAIARVLWLLGLNDGLFSQYRLEMCGIATLCVSNLALKPQSLLNYNKKFD